jgi:kinesin family protein C2/C3
VFKGARLKSVVFILQVLMFVNCSPCFYNAAETVCSLNFAARCRNVELGAAKKNSDGGGESVSKYKRQVEKLQEQLAALTR